ncbi:M23 family metallopeptidase (plasmid) [Glaciihabitans sp. INWT7]|uniref:M23 family metallopeptidase n=1 Tax=Glaciihabitans sp. INWT7 TaxID=2596912 RepID=UPI0016241E6B|nr:M23 family metallopeptidase [Glaciihabitans sp. INWT7]QNE48705.1 M23 family metallopeptidase [Glaciihabitans sp. INWT7]
MSHHRSLGFRRGLPGAAVMAGVALIFVASTIPANAFVKPADPTVTSASAGSSSNPQTITVSSTALHAASARDGYAVTLPPPPPPPPAPARVVSGASFDGRKYTYSAVAAGAVRWPFPDGSPIASGFGPRLVPNCSFCSTMHLGLDFTPGFGVPVHAIADGVVVLVKNDVGGLGNHVMIEHVIGGQRVQSEYGHMGIGTVVVSVGETVTAGQVIGQVGSTGASTGAHLHLEIHLAGVPVDPFVWLQANVG